MTRENTYIAIGHWRDSKNITSLVHQYPTMKDFRRDLRGNGFVTYVVMTESRLEKMKKMENIEVFYEVCKMTSNYRKWDEITDYIEECIL